MKRLCLLFALLLLVSLAVSSFADCPWYVIGIDGLGRVHVLPGLPPPNAVYWCVFVGGPVYGPPPGPPPVPVLQIVPEGGLVPAPGGNLDRHDRDRHHRDRDDD